MESWSLYIQELLLQLNLMSSDEKKRNVKDESDIKALKNVNMGMLL